MAKTSFEPSPLNRVQKTLAPANPDMALTGVLVKVPAEANVASEVRLWTVPLTSAPYLSAAVTMQQENLYRNITTDEHGKRMVEYKDKEGKIILKKVEIKASGCCNNQQPYRLAMQFIICLRRAF